MLTDPFSFTDGAIELFPMTLATNLNSSGVPSKIVIFIFFSLFELTRPYKYYTPKEPNVKLHLCFRYL
jgi:hypothetical protein